ncbi:MAG: hypothetical protein LBC85_05700 [Fibromonadaceae bacterium]|nr:hypothetical protein [Fibromonadaceae bacterium]
MYFRLFLLVFLAAGFCQASLIGFDVLGQEQSPKNAAIIRNGLAPQNPAVNAFENRTKFSTAILFEYANASEGDNSIGLNSFTTPSLSMVLPLGSLGVFGIGLEQKYFASNRLELRDQSLDANILYTIRTGLYELAPSYSLRLPFYNNFALGVSYRILFGNSFSALQRGTSQDWESDLWMARNVVVTERETGHFEMKGDWWQQLGGSVHFHKRFVDYFFSYFPAVEMQKNIRHNVQFSNADTLKSTKDSVAFNIPEHFASGVHFLFLKKHNLSLVYEQQNWEKTDLMEVQKAFSCLVEYKITGTGLHYTSFLKRNNFGVNAWYAEKYLKDVSELGISVFSDLWLGRRGTLASLALFGGYRDTKDPYWDEAFFGFKLNLTGVGNWGTSSRRR